MLARGFKIATRRSPLLKTFSSSRCVNNGNVHDELKVDHPFQVYDEYKVFETLLSYERYHIKDDLPYLEHVKKLRRVEENRQRQGKVKGANKLAGLLNKRKLAATRQAEDFAQRDQIRAIVARHTLTGKDIDSFLSIGLGDLHESKMLEWLLRALEVFVEESGPGTLPVVADQIASYWQLGVGSVKIMDIDARMLVSKVLERALSLYPETEYTTQNQEVVVEYGTEDIDSFRYFVDAYMDTFEVRRDDVLYDMLFHLAAKSGSVRIASAILDKLLVQGWLPTSPSIEAFIQALTRVINAERSVFIGSQLEFTSRMKRELTNYRQILISEQITPAVVEFLLLWTSNLDEAYSVLEIASKSQHCDDILSQCQNSMIAAIVKCGLIDGYSKAMAHMFGVLQRFVDCSAGITPGAYDQCLLLSATYGNAPGMYRAISMRQDDVEIPQDIIGPVLDRLPTLHGDMAKEYRTRGSWWMSNSFSQQEDSYDQVVLAHLRSLIKPSSDDVYVKYLSALGRFGLTEDVVTEWKSVPSVTRVPQDTVAAFLSALNQCNATKQSVEVLKQVLEASKDHHNGQAVGVLRKVLKYELIPLRQVVPFVAAWVLQNKESCKWSSAEIESLFAEITSPSAVNSLNEQEAQAAAAIGKTLAEAVTQIQGGKDVDDSISNLNDLLCKN